MPIRYIRKSIAEFWVFTKGGGSSAKYHLDKSINVVYNTG